MSGREGARGQRSGAPHARTQPERAGMRAGRAEMRARADSGPGGHEHGPGGQRARTRRAGTGQEGRYRMLTARAITSAPTPSDTADCTAIVSLAHRASGITSVGLNAVAFVNDR